MSPSEKPDDICPRPDRLPQLTTRPLVSPVYPTSVWQCANTRQAEQLLEGSLQGYVYQRDGHPNADLLAEKCRQLHDAQCAAVSSSGMAALALALLSQLQHGDQILISNQLYGRSQVLLQQEAQRLGMTTALADPTDLAQFESRFNEQTRMVVVETISNPMLRVVDLSALADRTHRHGALLLVDNTFATPALCRPLKWGADLVLESISKLMNGHSDVMLGLLCGHRHVWQRVPLVLSAWGLTSSPFDCWLATRGLATMHLRVQRAAQNALAAAQFLADDARVERVDYPGLANHPDHELATRQFNGQYGSIVTFRLAGGRRAADCFIDATRQQIPFCPSLGEVTTTLSHPESTSHRGLTAPQRAELGITAGTIRLSLGVESTDHVLNTMQCGLESLA